MKPITKSDIEVEDWNYDYQPALSKILDSHTGDFDHAIILEITLWKLNRYPEIDPEILEELNQIKKTDTSFDRHMVCSLLLRMLTCRGIKLPMASTYLRFKNPSLFQIIDQRVYRAIYGKKMNLPGAYNETNRKELVDIYFKYLEELRSKCLEFDISFIESDRILYNADKRVNKDVPIENY